jgi:hypothetical protein
MNHTRIHTHDQDDRWLVMHGRHILGCSTVFTSPYFARTQSNMYVLSFACNGLVIHEGGRRAGNQHCCGVGRAGAGIRGAAPGAAQHVPPAVSSGEQLRWRGRGGAAPFKKS